MPKEIDKSSLGAKDRLNKPPAELFAPAFHIEVLKVLEFGAKKYGAYNWTKGLELEATAASITRHLLAIRQGEFIDQESCLSHAAHIAANAMFIGELHRMNKLDTTSTKYYESN